MIFADACHKANINLAGFEHDLDAEEEKEVQVDIDQFFHETFYDAFASGKFKNPQKGFP
jgi:hypothetical protein